MRFALVAKHRSIWPVAWACKALDVSTSGFHDLLNRKPARRTIENETLLGLIRRSFHDSDRTYGARRVWRDVLTKGLNCGLHRIERLMRSNVLKARSRRRKLLSYTGLREVHTAARQTGCLAASLRPGQPIHIRAVQAANARKRRYLFHEQVRQCVGQCRNGELLRFTEDRMNSAQNLSNTRANQV